MDAIADNLADALERLVLQGCDEVTERGLRNLKSSCHKKLNIL